MFSHWCRCAEVGDSSKSEKGSGEIQPPIQAARLRQSCQINDAGSILSMSIIHSEEYLQVLSLVRSAESGNDVLFGKISKAVDVVIRLLKACRSDTSGVNKCRLHFSFMELELLVSDFDLRGFRCEESGNGALIGKSSKECCAVIRLVIACRADKSGGNKCCLPFSSEGSELSDLDCVLRVFRSAESGNGAFFEKNSKELCALFRVVKYHFDQAGVNHHSEPFSMKQFAAEYAVVDTVGVVVSDAVEYTAKYAVVSLVARHSVSGSVVTLPRAGPAPAEAMIDDCLGARCVDDSTDVEHGPLVARHSEEVHDDDRGALGVDNGTASMRDVDPAPEISQALQGLADESAQRRVDITNRLLDLGVQRAWASAPDVADVSAHMLALMAQCLDKSGVQPTDISSSVARKAELEALSVLADNCGIEISRWARSCVGATSPDVGAVLSDTAAPLGTCIVPGQYPGVNNSFDVTLMGTDVRATDLGEKLGSQCKRCYFLAAAASLGSCPPRCSLTCGRKHHTACVCARRQRSNLRSNTSWMRMHTTLYTTLMICGATRLSTSLRRSVDRRWSC